MATLSAASVEGCGRGSWNELGVEEEDEFSDNKVEVDVDDETRSLSSETA